MLKKLSADRHNQPFKGPFTITRVEPGRILGEQATGDTAFGPLAAIDHATMSRNLTIKMHEHVNDEILSYVWAGKMHHRDSAGFEAPISRGQLMMMNAGKSFWHEEKVHDEQVEMLQIFARPKETDLEPHIQFSDKPLANREWFLMAAPEGSEAPLFWRQNIYVFDAHLEAGDELEVPAYEGFKPFLYVMHGEVMVEHVTIRKQEAVTDLVDPLPPILANEDTTAVLFLVDMEAPMSLAGTISGGKAMPYETE